MGLWLLFSILLIGIGAYMVYNNEIMRYIIPIKMYEYMAMKKPVIATKLPGIIKEFGYGNGVQYIDKPRDTIPKVLEMIDNNKINIEGERGRNFVRRYEWSKIVDLFEKTLKNVIKQKR